MKNKTKKALLQKKKKTLNSKKIKETDWLSREVFILLAIIFITVQTTGLFVAKQLMFLGMQQTSFTGDVNDATNAIYLFGMIISMTIIILIALRFGGTKKLLWLVELLAVFSTSVIVINAFIYTNDLLVLFLTGIIILVRYTHRENILIRDIVGLIAIAGAGAYLGVSFGLIPILAFMIILAIYDIIAVFVTKHMTEIGKAATKNNFAFTIALPTKKHTFELGNGDLVIPLMAATSILINGPFHNNGLIAGACLGASFIGLMISIYLVSKQKIAMPALPPQTVLMAIVIIASVLLGA